MFSCPMPCRGDCPALNKKRPHPVRSGEVAHHNSLAWAAAQAPISQDDALKEDVGLVVNDKRLGFVHPFVRLLKLTHKKTATRMDRRF